MPEPVSLVIPGRNAAKVLRPCLDAATALLGRDGLAEILFVDDGSTDDTARIAAEYRARILTGRGAGPGAARNIGWRAVSSGIVWFIDADCVARPDALALLVPFLSDPKVGGVGGSYDNLCPDSLLACLIQEEIALRHLAMTTDVNYLASFNVLYRKEALMQVGGFDETEFNGPGSPGAEDIDFSFRVHRAGYRLCFEPRSRVGHFHPTRLGRYLRTQRHHGYYRVRLYLRHRGRAAGDSYSGLVDHVQPPLALLLLVSLPLVFWPMFMWVPGILVVLLALAQVPLTIRLIRRMGPTRSLWFPPLGMVRALWRGLGMAQAVLGRWK